MSVSNAKALPADAQELIEICRSDPELDLIRTLLESKNQKLIFEQNNHLQPHEFQALGTVMLFVAIERNSDLVFGALRFLNVLHRLNPTTVFVYERGAAPLIDRLAFGSVADSYLDDLLMTLYACAESPFNGARPEALTFFAGWVRSSQSVAYAAFVRIAVTWPWTNRNKYYFLSLLCEAYGFARLLREASGTEQHAMLDRGEFVRGLTLSLQYRNLIAPGQTLAITLCRQSVPEMFEQLAWLLRRGPRFEAMNCLNHWMRCVSGTERVFRLLELDSAELLTAERFEYLRARNFERLVLFRACFKKPFNDAVLLQQIDAIVDGRPVEPDHADGDDDDVQVKLAQLDIIIANTIERPNDMVRNIGLITSFMRYTMRVECTALRQSILKLIPNLLYLLVPLLRRENVAAHIRQFFRTLRMDVVEAGLDASDEVYQPVVFGCKLLQVMIKTLHGARSDRIIKRFNVDVNAKISAFLNEADTWPLLDESNYRRLLRLLNSEFEDVRDIACELLVRFFPANNIRDQCEMAVRDVDIHRCGRTHLMARVAIGFGGGVEWCSRLRHTVRQLLLEYAQDPLCRMREPGGHLFGAVDAINVVYESAAAQTEISAEHVTSDVRLAEHVAHVILGYLQFGGECADDGGQSDGSASFERMDRCLGSLVRRSAAFAGSNASAGDLDANKQWLLLSLWSTLRAVCNWATSIAVLVVGRWKRQTTTSTADNHDDTAAVRRCYDICTSVLLKCRHKGAIEAAGLALGRLVRAITSTQSPDSTAYRILLDSVHKVFAIVGRTDTTRRGAGLTIMVHHLVRNERHARRPLLVAVMRDLLSQGTEWQGDQRSAGTGGGSHEHTSDTQNRDNRLAAVLHFLGTLVRDGDLRTALLAYASDIFALTMATIESEEWTVRNAALQLFGALVPKMVGQTQFFANELAWQPVYTVIGDVRRKQPRIHAEIVRGLRHCSSLQGLNSEASVVRLVSLLELMSRIEVVDASGALDGELRGMFYDCLRSRSDKVRELAARCLVHFHQWYELEQFVCAHVRSLATEPADVNFQQGVVRTVEMMLLKWSSDGRCMPGNTRDLYKVVRDELRRIRPDALFQRSYYLRCYVFDLMRLVGCNNREAALLGPGSCVEKDVISLKKCNENQIGFDVWAEKVLHDVRMNNLV